jgi:hypothetical protein
MGEVKREGFLDHQCGIARAQADRGRNAFRIARTPDGIGVPRNARDAPGARLFDQLQQRPAALTVRRFLIVRSWRRRILRQHRIAQGLQFRVRNPIEFHPKLEDGHGDQLSGLPVGAVDENRPALLECR